MSIALDERLSAHTHTSRWGNHRHAGQRPRDGRPSCPNPEPRPDDPMAARISWSERRAFGSLSDSLGQRSGDRHLGLFVSKQAKSVPFLEPPISLRWRTQDETSSVCGLGGHAIVAQAGARLWKDAAVGYVGHFQMLSACMPAKQTNSRTSPCQIPRRASDMWTMLFSTVPQIRLSLPRSTPQLGDASTPDLLCHRRVGRSRGSL